MCDVLQKSIDACSCTDCEAACVPPDLGKYDGGQSDFEVTYGASVGAVFVLGLVAMAAGFIWQRKSKVNSQTFE